MLIFGNTKTVLSHSNSGFPFYHSSYQNADKSVKPDSTYRKYESKVDTLDFFCLQAQHSPAITAAMPTVFSLRFSMSNSDQYRSSTGYFQLCTVSVHCAALYLREYQISQLILLLYCNKQTPRNTPPAYRQWVPSFCSKL